MESPAHVSLTFTLEGARSRLSDIRRAAGKRGSNDEEHDLLMEYADLLTDALGQDAPAPDPRDEF